jgi:pilus assembly protein CpaB
LLLAPLQPHTGSNPIMNQRALLVALGLAALSAFFLFKYTRQFEQEMSGGERIELLVVAKPVARGVLLTDDMLGVREVPLAYVESRAVKATERAKILGVRTAQSVQAQDLLMWSDLAVTSEERDLSSLVQPGNRAVTVRATNGDDSRSYALIRPGDYVDVLATMADSARSATDTRSSIVLLQKVLVLAVGLDTESGGSNGSAALQADHNRARDLILTLSLNLQEAQLLALATEKGRLSVALRNPEDQRVTEGIPDMASTALFDSHARLEIQNVRRASTNASGPIKLQ